MLKTKYSRPFFFFFILCFLKIIVPGQIYAEGSNLQNQLDQANAYIKSYRHFEAVDIMQEAIAEADSKHPSLHMRLGILYYGLGLLPEAINEGQKAVALKPSSKWYNFDLAKFYFAAKQIANAELQFNKLLKLDPGFTLGYYYLAKIYSQQKDYDRAWLSLQRARLLGFQSLELFEELKPLSSQPEEDLKLANQANDLFRFIETSDEQKARAILKQLQAGKYFENIELERITEKDETTLFGQLMGNELREENVTSLKDSPPYAPPVLVTTGFDYRIMQKILPFPSDSWDKFVQPKKERQSSSTQTIQTLGTDGVKRADGIKPKKQKLSYKLAAMYAVENWQMAWSEQNVAEYLDAYSSKFVPSGNLSFNNWKIKRKRSLSRPSYITLEIKDLVIEVAGDSQMQATFVQNYQSDIYSDIVRKRLIMEKESNGWKIVAENEIEKLSK